MTGLFINVDLWYVQKYFITLSLFHFSLSLVRKNWKKLIYIKNILFYIIK